MKFSIIIPVYNCERYLEECLNSILNQTYNDFEIILVNDGSTDSSSSICRKYVYENDYIKLINKENGGPSSARNLGIKYAQGEYVVCVDSDDYIHPDLLRTIASSLENEFEPDMVCFGYQIVWEDSISKPIFNPLKEGTYSQMDTIWSSYLYDATKANENTGCLIYSLWCKAIRRNIFEKAQEAVPDYIKNGEDIALTAFALSYVSCLKVIEFAGYYYRENIESITHVRKAYDLINVSNVANIMDTISVIPSTNISHNYFYSIYILVNDIAKQTNSYFEFRSLIKELIIIEKYKHIKPYGRQLNYKHKIKYFLIQHELWLLLFILCKVH